LAPIAPANSPTANNPRIFNFISFPYPQNAPNNKDFPTRVSSP
jgi:hypothetical protein